MLTRIDEREAREQLIKSVEKGVACCGSAIRSGTAVTQIAELDVHAPSWRRQVCACNGTNKSTPIIMRTHRRAGKEIDGLCVAVREYRLRPLCKWYLLSSGMLFSVDWSLGVDVSGQHWRWNSLFYSGLSVKILHLLYNIIALLKLSH
jgi:hypothetical protein